MENQTKTKKAKLPKLTKKQRGFVKDYIETGNGVESALNNYDTEDYNTANQIAIENLQKPTIQNAIKSIAEQIPDSLIVEKHLALLNKEEVITKNNVTTGEIDVIPTGQIDAQAVKAGLDMAYKLKGSYVPEKPETPKENIYNFFFEPKFQQNIKNYDQNLKEQILNKDVEED